MARATWAWRPLRGSLWMLKDEYCHHDPPKPIPGTTEGVRKRRGGRHGRILTPDRVQERVGVRRGGGDGE